MEIVHRAAPCRNVPVTYTLAVIVRAIAVTVVLSFSYVCGFSQAATSSDLLRDLDGIGRRAVEKACPGPLRVTTNVVRNRHDPNVRDEVRQVTCPGLKAETYISRASDPPRTLPLALTARGLVESMPTELQVGTATANLLIALGKPTKTGRGWLSYALPSEAGNDIITFRTRNDKVTAIHWSWDVD